MTKANMSKTMFIAVGQNYWEKRDTIDDALKALKRACSGGMTPPKWKAAVYRVDPSTVLDGMGRFCWPRAGSKPELVRAVEVTKTNGRIKDLPLDDFR